MTFGEGNGTPLQYSCLENPMNGGAWKAAVYGVAEGQTRLSDFTFTNPNIATISPHKKLLKIPFPLKLTNKEIHPYFFKLDKI